MAAAQQLRLLLWKDYLIRKRKPITLAGILWATFVMLSLYVVRINIDNIYHPTCQFAARALPSAGILPFLQSFICNVNNECSPMDQYQQIPTYENARFTQIQREISPLIDNETILDVASTVPGALKLLATMSDVADNPTFLDIVRRGLFVGDLFRSPRRVRKYLSTKLDISEDVADTIMASEIGIGVLFKGGINICVVDSMSRILKTNNLEHLRIFVDRLCNLPKETMQDLTMDLLMELDLGKYIKMGGDMYYKLSADDRIIKIADMVTGALRMMSFDSFLPPELSVIFNGQEVDFSYINMTMISLIMDVFKPTFGETESYKSLREITDTAVIGVQYLSKFLEKSEISKDSGYTNNKSTSNIKTQLSKINQIMDNVVNAVSGFVNNESFDIYKMALEFAEISSPAKFLKSNKIFEYVLKFKFSQITNFILKWLSSNDKHDFMLYSTLFAKLLEAAEKVVNININIEQWLYNASLRNPQGVTVLLHLPVSVIGKGLEALADTERTQILVSKISKSQEMFCDLDTLEKFFLVSKEESIQLKTQLCTDAWANYTNDLITSFGIQDVKNNINNMASIFILEALGKDTSDKLYTIDDDFNILKNFTSALGRLDTVEKPKLDWRKVFNVSEDSEFLKMIKAKAGLEKHMLINIHGAFAQEVVKQNPLLNYKITPFLMNIIIMVEALENQLDTVPSNITRKAKELYPQILQTILETAFNEEKTYKALSTPYNEIFCNGEENASKYLEFPPNIDRKQLSAAVCDISLVISDGLKNTSIIAKTLKKIFNTTDSTFEEVDWTKLVNGLNNLYEKLYKDYTYVFEYKSYGMDEALQKINKVKLKKAIDFWFSLKNMNRLIHIMAKFGLRVLDILDSGVFDITNDVWLKIKYGLSMMNGPVQVVHDIIGVITGAITNKDKHTNLPDLTASLLRDIAPNMPQFIFDAADLMTKYDLDVGPVIGMLNESPAWPCSTTSLYNILPFNRTSSKNLQSLEALSCFNSDLQNEWNKYLSQKNVSSLPDWNSTVSTYPDHVFLKFSATFDLLVEGLNNVNEIAKKTFSSNDDTNMASALEYLIDAVNDTDRPTLRKFFSKVDKVLNEMNTSTVAPDVTLKDLWKNYFDCSDAGDFELCRLSLRTALVYTLRSFSVNIQNLSGDLYKYFKEVNDPNATVLQVFGFTSNTGMYTLYDKLPDFISVLVNSYLDLGFMSQIRRASELVFWDCEDVLRSLKPGPGSTVSKAVIEQLQPLVCPSLFYWISTPIGDNILLDVIAKPQFLLYKMNISTLSSNYEDAYMKTTNLTDYLKDLSFNTSAFTQDFSLDTMKAKLASSVDTLFAYKINKTDSSYVAFNNMTEKQTHATIYLTNIVMMVNKFAEFVDKINVSDLISNVTEEEQNKLTAELDIIKKIPKRNPHHFIALHFDVLTDMLWRDDKNYKIVDAMKYTCDKWKNKNIDSNIVLDSERIKAQICSKNYTLLYKSANNIFNENSGKTRESLVNFVSVLNSQPNTNITDITSFFNSREDIVNSLKTSILYAYDLKIPIYLKYLHNNLEHYNIILSFLTGENWWVDFRNLYNKEPVIIEFLDTIENALSIAEDVVANVDKIHIVKLMNDIQVNNTEKFCQPNLTLADYVPDSTKALSLLHHHLCAKNRNDIIKGIPPLLFAAQGYINQLSLPTDVDYESISSDVDKIQLKVKIIRDGPEDPIRPPWVTDKKVASLRSRILQLTTKESLTKMSFGVISNAVDAGTLILNNSQCTLCSQLTTWFKQINLQLYKKQEYDNLLCQLEHMTLEDIHYTLKNEFHWDMAITELISTRNYTKYELNKSINEFLEQVKLHLLEDMTSNSTKISECLLHNVTRNVFGNVTLFAKVLVQTAKLLRSQLPHLQEIKGISDLPFLKQLYSDVAHNLMVQDELANYLTKNFTTEMSKLIEDQKVLSRIERSQVNLRAIGKLRPVEEYLTLDEYSWGEVCQRYDCDKLAYTIVDNLNTSLLQTNLRKFQQHEFWQFTFIANILYHQEVIVDHLARVMGSVSRLDIEGVVAGNLTAMLDTGMQILMDDTLDSLLYSILGLLDELQVLLKGTALEYDITAITEGLTILHDLKNYVVEQDIQVEVSKIFSNPERIELEFGDLGINNTNFWSVAAPRIHAGYVRLKPIFAPKTGIYRIKNFACQAENMSTVMIPRNIDVVTLDDIYGAVIEQFCGLTDDEAKLIIPILMENLNYTYIIDGLKSVLLSKLYKASDLTQEEGDDVLNKFEVMTELIPTVQTKFSGISETLANEPLLMQLRKGGSFKDLLSGSDILANTGKLMCGKPFQTDLNRFFKTIVQLPDQSSTPDDPQLQAMPTEFCRELYTEITRMEGGKIIWSYAKPLLFGKILYTPPHPVVEKIVQKANSTFAPMFKLVNIVHSFAHTAPALGKLGDHRDGLKGLKDVITAPQFADLLGDLIGNITAPDVNVDEIFESFGDIKDINSLMKKASNLLHCVNLDRFKAVADEYELGREAAKLTGLREFSAGLVFMNLSSTDTGMPTNIEYKIRMDIENAPTTNKLKNFMWVPGPEANFLENMRYFRGFIQIQDLIEKSIVELSMNNSRRVQKREAVKREEKQAPVNWAVYTQQTPYPCYTQDMFQTSLYESQALVVAFVFALLLTVSSAVRFIVSDKESGNTMLMSVMGVNLTYHTFSWFVLCLAEMVVTVGCITAVLSLGQVLPRTDPNLIFVLFLIYGISALSFSYMISKLFSSASFAGVCTGIAFICTFMPFVIILSQERILTDTLKIIVSLSSSSSICYALYYLTRYEATGSGAGWAQLWDTPEGDTDMSIGVISCMVIVDTVLYFLIGLMLDYFIGVKSVSNVTNCQAIGEKAGVSIVNITKVYGGSRKPKVALDGVSMELHKGQITALLGQNGAGKTTLIKILTGMAKPSTGHVIVRSEDGSRATLGVCPQKDVLFENLTAEEHVAMYAQLKSGLPLKMVREEIDSLLRVLSLGEARREPVSSLSGGTRRRLCVALAFVGRPQFVSLDEPTAGVDPAARRDIWSMITKLRANRTILLTTHHLDEAELLSDQIVIMHKGQIHTTGTPIEIKRSLGTGYTLSVVYPDIKHYLLEDADVPEENSLEEKTKNLLAVTRSVIKNANLVDVNGLEVEINLPFYDSDGVSNNFLLLCSTLEEQKSHLEYSSYNMECSSLEQVFYNICQQADAQPVVDNEVSSKSASTSSIRAERSLLVPLEGPLRASIWQQFLALLHLRYMHYTRNRWLLFMLLGLPAVFVTLAMAFSMFRPQTVEETSLRLHRQLYEPLTDFLVTPPSALPHNDITLAQTVLDTLRLEKQYRNWTPEDSPTCKCVDENQQCDVEGRDWDIPRTMVLPDAATTNRWLVDSMKVYIKKRYGGFSAVVRDNTTHLVAWYNNKGHHAMPAYVNALNTALLRAATGHASADIALYTHPIKISKEQINKDTLYQHVADAGTSAMLLIGYSLVAAGSAVYLVTTRVNQEKRLQLLCGVSPALYWLTALLWDLVVIVVNIGITAVLLELFHFPVFVARNNLPAICLLIFLFGYACSGLVHLAEKLFSEPSLANMMLFCGNTFLGLAGITVLLIMDIISDSDATDYARWLLHKIFMISPQFVLADGLLEIAKNTVQYEVLLQFGLDTYRDPLHSSLVAIHFGALVLVGTVLIALNLAVEYHCFDALLDYVYSRFRPRYGKENEYSIESEEIRSEAARVRGALEPLRLRTIGNINAGYVVTEDDTVKLGSLKRWSRLGAPGSGRDLGDAAACLHVSRVFRTRAGYKYAVKDLALGIPRGQCTALLGENGAGKSTTFAMLTGQLRPTAGQLYLDNRKVTSRGLCQGLISYCPQQDAIDPLLTVKETLQFYCRLRGIDNSEEVIKRTIEMFELTKYVDVRNGTLSGGNKRKLCTAIAFMSRTPLVLLDEPTSGMDPGSRGGVWRGMRAASGAGRATLLSTHALDDARRAAHRVALMRAARLHAVAPLDDCLKRFGGGYVCACRVGRRGAREAWRRVAARSPATLQLLHTSMLHVLLPANTTVDGKEVHTSLADVFRLMTELQADGDIDDFTVNQSSLDQMFLSYSDRKSITEEEGEEPEESHVIARSGDELDVVTAL